MTAAAGWDDEDVREGLMGASGEDGAESRRPSGAPLYAVVGVFTGVLLVLLAQPALLDVDVYWHVRAGDEVLQGSPLRLVGSHWSLVPAAGEWVTSQWLAEVTLAMLERMGSWSALVDYRLVTAASTLGLLARATLRRDVMPLAVLPYSIATLGVIFASQERPQQATLMGAAWLGGLLANGLRAGTVPQLWLVLPVTVVWANFHGGWILVPAVMAIIALGRALDNGVRDPAARSAAGLVVASAVAGSLTPVGTAGLLAGARFREAASAIREWGVTSPLSDIGLLTAGMLLLVGIAWSRRGRIPWSEFLAIGLLFGFAWTATRNVAPALLLMSPLVARRLALAFPGTQREEPAWSRTVGVSAALGLLVVALLSTIGRDPLPRATYPVDLAGQIGDLPGDQRVLNEYNAAGLVLQFANPADQVGIDGRTDYYGAEYIGAYLEMMHLQGDWRGLLERLDPTVAILVEDRAMTHFLVDDLGWTQLGEENGYVLLQRPEPAT